MESRETFDMNNGKTLGPIEGSKMEKLADDINRVMSYNLSPFNNQTKLICIEADILGNMLFVSLQKLDE